MSSSSTGKHAGTGAASNQPTVAEPSFAERARTLVYRGRNISSGPRVAIGRSLCCVRVMSEGSMMENIYAVI